MVSRRVLLILGVSGLLFLAVGTLVALNWEELSGRLGTALEAQGQKTQATLFRWGEVMSIGARLEERFGVAPEMTYDTDEGNRMLKITFSDLALPEGTAAEEHAREIAAFAIGQTKKTDQIDTVLVQLPLPSGARIYRFTPSELLSSPEQTEAA